MIVECCSQERSYSNFYGLIGERFCKLNRVWTDNFQEAFAKYFDTIHRYETNKLRNIGRFFGHLLASDAISWAVLHAVHLNEDETTSSSRIFIKIMMQEMVEEMSLAKVAERFRIPDLAPAFAGLFPMDNPKNTRFAINYFTSIGMGKVTEEMRTYLQNAPKLLAAQHAALNAASSDGDSSSDLSDTDSSDLSDTDASLTPSEDSRYARKRNGGGGGGGAAKGKRYSREDSRSPPPRRSPPARAAGGDRAAGKYRAESRPPSPAAPRRRSPPPRRRYSDDSPPRRRRYSDDSPPPARRRSPPAARRGSNSRSPSPQRRRRYSPSRSPPARRDSPPRRDVGYGQGGRRDQPASPPRRRER